MGLLIMQSLFLVLIQLSNLPRHAEISNLTHAHFIHEHVLEFEVTMDESYLLVKIAQTSNDLSEHHTGDFLFQSRSTVTPKNVVK
jgi:hypothetical protein